MKLTEDQLCEAFAEGIKDRPEFSVWVLEKTKFAPFARQSRILHREQMAIRPRKQWWRHWWCHVPGLEKARETDIFIVFETMSSSSSSGVSRFALHIENKRDNYRFNDGQAAAYSPRARHMMDKVEFLSHSDFSTVLLAPRSFKARFELDSAHFDTYIAYEDVAHFLPAFAVDA